MLLPKELSLVLCDSLEGWDGEVGGGSRGRAYMFMTDSHCCMAGTNTTLESTYPPVKNKNFAPNGCKHTHKVSLFSYNLLFYSINLIF